MSALECSSMDLLSHFRERETAAASPTAALTKAASSDSNDSHDLIVQALERAHSFSESHPRSTTRKPSSEHRERWGSCPADYFRKEPQLQTRRNQAESSVMKLFDDRKDHIFELFQDSWIISDALEDDEDGLDCA